MKFETTIEKKKALAHVRFDWMWDNNRRLCGIR